jgi:hypothetical protein
VLAQRTADEPTIAPGAARCDVGLATTRGAHEAAFRLVHDRYVASGYIDPDPSGARVAFHQTLPSTRVFVGREAGRVVATVSLVVDSEHGLPCDTLYPTELAAMRATHPRLAEVSALAVRDGGSEGYVTVRALMQCLAVYAVRIAHLDALCITVNPRHTRFYERRLGFEQFGPMRAYDLVKGAEAVPLRLDLRRAVTGPGRDAFAASLMDTVATDHLVRTLRRDLGEVRLKSFHPNGAYGAVGQKISAGVC